MYSDNKSLLGHFEELRKTLLKCIVVVTVLVIPSFFVAPHLLRAFILWANPPTLGALNYFSPMEVFIVQTRLAAVLALMFSFPFCLWEVWKFLLPGLYPKERKALIYWVGASVFLFLTGAVFCAALILPMVMKFSASFASEHIRPVISLQSFLSLSAWLIFAFGLCFQFPLAVMLSVRFGLVKTAFLKDKRPYIVVAILIIAAVLTPPDIISQIALFLPAYALFEIGLFLAGRLEPQDLPENPQNSPSDDTMLDFYAKEENRKTDETN